jgi:lipopolysaccharide exporter
MTAPIPQKRSSFFTNVLKLVSGTTVAQAITVITAPILSRLFLPESFGILSVFTSLIGIVSIVVCLRYEYAIVLPEEDADAINIFALCLMIALAISGAVGLVLLFLGNSLVNLLKAPNLFPFLWIVPLGLLIQGFFAAFNYWNARTKHFGRLSVARVSASLTTSALPMFLAYIGRANTATLVFSWVAGTFIFTFVLASQVLRDKRTIALRLVERSKLLVNMKRYRKFPLVDSWSSFINNFSWQLPSLVLLYYFSEKVVGYYSLSSRMILLPMTLLGSALAQVFYQRTAELRSDPEKLTQSVELVFMRLAAVGLFPAVVLGIAGPELFSIVFGANWVEAGRYAQILSPWMFVLFVSSPLTILFATLERQELALIVNSIILVTRIAALVIGGMTNNIYLTLIIWSGTGVLVYGGLSLGLLKLTHVHWSSAFGSVLRYLLFACVPALLLLGGKKPLTPSPVWLLLLTGLVTLAYYALVLSRDRNLRNYIIALIPLRSSISR